MQSLCRVTSSYRMRSSAHIQDRGCIYNLGRGELLLRVLLSGHMKSSKLVVQLSLTQMVLPQYHDHVISCPVD